MNTFAFLCDKDFCDEQIIYNILSTLDPSNCKIYTEIAEGKRKFWDDILEGMANGLGFNCEQVPYPNYAADKNIFVLKNNEWDVINNTETESLVLT